MSPAPGSCNLCSVLFDVCCTIMIRYKKDWLERVFGVGEFAVDGKPTWSMTNYTYRRRARFALTFPLYYDLKM